MKDKIIKNLGANFKTGTESVIDDFIDNYYSIACDNSNRRKDDKRLIPYVYNAVIMSYQRRGDEGSSSSSEGSLSSSYIDIEEKLAKDVSRIRVVK